MEAKLHGLPPLKRFRLLHREKQQQQQQPESDLPAKKRKQSRETSKSSESVAAITPPTTFCLPAKKRVWAIRPEFSPTKSPHSCSSFDINVEYTPSPQKDAIETNTTTHGESHMSWEDPNVASLNAQNIKTNSDRPTENFSEKLNPDGIIQDEEDDGILCAVCESTDGDPSDPIVICDGCELMVHASCYGNPLVKGIPEGDWFCAQCSVSKSSEKCCLCPVTRGAMKPTTDGRWAHITCAVLVPEVFFENSEGREGINCDKIPKKRWREICYVCKGSTGCVVECSEPKCPLAFHVSCGLKEELCIELKEGKSSGGVVAAFCKNHTELWKTQQQTGKFRIVAREEHNH